MDCFVFNYNNESVSKGGYDNSLAYSTKGLSYRSNIIDSAVYEGTKTKFRVEDMLKYVV